MLRLLHTADLRLGARHEDLGPAAPAVRERQHGALRAAVDLALAEHVDAVLVTGDLFAANAASRRTVERAAAELARLASARIRVVLLPGHADAYTRSSVYRAYDLPSLAGNGMLSVLTPEAPWVHLDSLDAVVVGPADPAGTGGATFATHGAVAATWRIGLLHAPIGDGPDAVPAAAIERSGLDLAALGGGDAASGRAGGVAWAVAGPAESADLPEPGTVNLIRLDERAGVKSVTVETRPVGSTRRRAVEIDAGTLASQEALVAELRAMADPGVRLEVEITGDRADALELDPAAIENALGDAYLHIRVEDRSRPPLTTGALPPPETVAGAFLRTVEGRIADLESTGAASDATEAEELREVLRLGRRLLAGAEVAL